MIWINILFWNSVVRGENNPKDNFETVKVNSGLHVGQGFTNNFNSNAKV